MMTPSLRPAQPPPVHSDAWSYRESIKCADARVFEVSFYAALLNMWRTGDAKLDWIHKSSQGWAHWCRLLLWCWIFRFHYIILIDLSIKIHKQPLDVSQLLDSPTGMSRITIHNKQISSLIISRTFSKICVTLYSFRYLQFGFCECHATKYEYWLLFISSVSMSVNVKNLVIFWPWQLNINPCLTIRSEEQLLW